MRTVVYSIIWRYWAPPVLLTLAIMCLSGDLGSATHTSYIFRWLLSWVDTINSNDLALLHSRLRKLLHFVCYGVLTVFWFRALMATYPERSWANILLALILGLAVALIDEGHQYVVETRTASWGDVGLDLAGGVVFLFLGARYFEKKMMVPSKAQPPSS